MEVLFKRFLEPYGISMVDVSMFYYKTLTRKSFLPLKSLSDLWSQYKKILFFITRPKIWSERKFKNLGLNPRYTAVLTTASSLVILFPLITLKFLRSSI